MNIPFMRLDRQYAEHREEFSRAVEKVLVHGRVLQGPEVKELEQRMAGFFGLDHGVAVGSGTDALILALKALGIGPGHKVAVTSLSFVASASAIAHVGAVPVFVDIEDDCFTAREDRLFELVDKKMVQGVIAVHIYGQMVELEPIWKRARENGIRVIEDAAQALGASRKGFAPGKFSDATCLSFDPTKVIGAHGSGGMVLCDDPETAEALRLLRYHGHAGQRVFTRIGHNSQLPTVQASLIDMKMNHEAEWRARRQAVAARFTAALADNPLIRAPLVREGNEHIFHKYVMLVKENRDGLAGLLKDKGIGSSVHYSLPLHHQPCFKGAHETFGPMETVEKTVKHILSLPIYPELTDPEVDLIAETVRGFKG